MTGRQRVFLEQLCCSSQRPGAGSCGTDESCRWARNRQQSANAITAPPHRGTNPTPSHPNPTHTRQVELIGANILANASREQMSYTIDCLGVHTPQALELLADSVLNPAFEPREIEEQKARLAAVLSSPDVQLTLLTELLVRGAYEGALARPLIPDPAALAHLTPEVLSGFVASQYLGPRVVLAGAGVDHRRLVEWAAPMLEALPAVAAAGAGGDAERRASGASASSSGGSEPASRYVGCHTLVPGSAPQTNLILAFEYGGGWHDIQVGPSAAGQAGRGSDRLAASCGRGGWNCAHPPILAGVCKALLRWSAPPCPAPPCPAPPPHPPQRPRALS
jgi:hypothetical protein